MGPLSKNHHHHHEQHQHKLITKKTQAPENEHVVVGQRSAATLAMAAGHGPFQRSDACCMGYDMSKEGRESGSPHNQKLKTLD